MSNSEEMLKSLWLHRLSAQTQANILSSADSLENLAGIEDNVKIKSKPINIYSMSKSQNNSQF